MMKLLSSISILLVVGLISCQQTTTMVTRSADYEPYLKVRQQNELRSLHLISEEMEFWSQRLAKRVSFDPVSGTKLAGLYASRFRIAGDIGDLHKSDSLYQLATPFMKLGGSSIYRSLAANAIAQHRFRQAKLFIDTALAMGDEKYISLLMQCDVSIELGDLAQARRSLSQIKDKDDFDYLIREAKLLDHEGDLPGAIKKMERAAGQVASANNDKLFCWARTNLGDMYGHDNRWSKAYQCYLAVLEKDPEDFYALKGIAWLAYSHDRNLDEAKRILSYLAQVHPVPDYYLLLAEIAEFENDTPGKEKYETKFRTKASDPLYGDMYNKYLFSISRNVSIALSIAAKEVKNRPTPQSYDLLSWASYQSGERKLALKIARSFVENKNFEPDALYHLGLIYADNGYSAKARKYLEEARRSAFELGPVMTKHIETALENL
jgi:tetratricopeptide (TPR) repeat protein